MRGYKTEFRTDSPLHPRRQVESWSTGLKSELWRVSGVVLAAFLISLLVDGIWVFILIAILLIYPGWHLFNLIRLSRRLAIGELLQYPYPGGVWGEIYEQIYRLQRQKRKSKGKFTRFREVASAMPDAVVILSENGQIQWCNPEAQRMLGLYWPKSMGQPLIKLIDHPVLQEYLSTGNYSRPLEFSSPTNRAKILSLRIARFGKHADHHLLVARDITQVYHLNQAQQDFVANVSHELRTPLTVIVGVLETMHYDGVEQRRWGRLIGLMEGQAHRMQDIISELLMLSRLQITERTQPQKPVFVANLLASIVKEARILSAESKHRITLAADPVAWLQGDSGELRSAFSNLVLNAVKHTPPRAEVDIRWFADETGAHLTVRDTGEGIAARHIPRLTERFYRVDPGRTRATGGTGLGLAIVKHVMDRHNGELRIVSEVGRGSIFSCNFPCESVIIRNESKSWSYEDAPTSH